jgi:hypothetical protein
LFEAIMDTRKPQQPGRTTSSNPQTGATQTAGSQTSKGPAGSPTSSSAAPSSKTAGSERIRPAGATEAPLQPSGMEDPANTARDFARQATSAAASLASDLQQTAKAATRAAKEQASEFAADVGHELTKTAEEQKVRGVEAIQGFARAINSAAGDLEAQSPMVARYVRDAAKQVDGLSHNIHGRSVTELMQAATDLARAQPALFFAGAMAAGFALSRFLKSSAPRSDSGGDGRTTSGEPYRSGQTAAGGAGQYGQGGRSSAGGTEYGRSASPSSYSPAGTASPARGS